MTCITAETYLDLKKYPLIVYAGPVVVWIMFFWLGVYLSKRKRHYNITWIIMGATLSFILMLVETKLIHNVFGGNYGIKPTSFVYSFLIILLLFSRRMELSFKGKNSISRMLVIVGDYSFPIYLIHCFVIMILSHFKTIPLWGARWAIVMAITMSIIYVLRKILPSKFLKVIGF